MSYGVDALLKQRDDIDGELRKHKAPVTVMFTDLAGSTSYFDRFGDTAGVKWIEEHNQIVIPLLKTHDGTLVKTIGDSVMAYFTEPGKAASAARDIQQKLFAANQNKPQDSQMFVRVALHQGLGYLRGGDVFGDVVNVTARIAKACLPGQILTSEVVYLSLQQAPDLEFNPVGAMQFHGKSAKESVFELSWTDPETYAELRRRFPPKAAVQHEDLSEGRYQVLAELGRGAMGVVYKAFDRVIGRTVAMKTIPLEIPAEEREPLVQRLKQEARTVGILDHPNIIMVFDVGEEAGLFYFTMQYVEGRTLSSILAEKGLLPLKDLLEIADQMCRAVGFAHQHGIIHRDLKPSNMMVTEQGVLKILDFGIAKLGDVGLTRAGTIVGTPSYLSPEQAAGRRLDHRSDIFSLGSVLYELLTGEKAFSGESTTTVIYKVLNEEPIPPSVIERSLPSGLDVIVRKALAKDPKQRFQSCEEMRTALQQAWQEAAIPAVSATSKLAKLQDKQETATGAPPVAEAPATRSRTALWIGVAAAAVLAAGIGFYVLRPQARAPESPGLIQIAPNSTSAPSPAAGSAGAATVAAPANSVTPEKLPAAGATRRTGAPAGAPHAAKATPPPAPSKTEAVTPITPISAPAKAAEKGERSAPAAEVAEEKHAPPEHSSMFSRGDIPDLLSKADGYTGRGQYDKATVLYQEILKLDPKNEDALQGMRKVKEARGIRR